MQETDAITCLDALAQESRLKAFRLLIQAGPDGLAAGAIALRLEILPATLSFHLKELERAGLVTAARRSRHIYYRANYPAMSALLKYLMQDCCQNNPEICASLTGADQSGFRATG